MGIYQLPRGPVQVGKSEHRDEPDDYKRNLLAWRESARDEAIDALNMNPEYPEIQKYIDFLEGRQWAANRPKYRSRFFDNRLMDARIEKLSTLSDIRPTIDVSSRVKAYGDQANIAQNIIHAEWTRNAIDLKLQSVIDHACFATGYWKIGAVLPGEICITSCGMDSVLPIQRGQHLQDSQAVLYRTYKPLQYFKNIWGDASKGLEHQATTSSWVNSSNDYVRPGHIPEYTWNSLSPAMRYHLGIRAMRRVPHGGGAIFPVIPLEEYWIDDPAVNESGDDVLVQDPNLPLNLHNYWYRVKPGERLYPRKRLLVFAGDRIMHDGPSPYWHGLFPFADLTLMPVVWAPSGLSMYRNLLPLNQAINHTGAGVQDVVEKAIRPQMVTKDGAVRDATWAKFFPDMPGGKLKLTANSNPSTDVRWMDPPNIPAYVFQHMSQYLIPTFDRRSGKIDMAQLGKKKQVPGGDTIEQMKDSMHTPFRIESRFVEVFLRDAGIQVVSHIFQFYTMEQRMRMLGADGLTWEDFDYDPNSMVPDSQPKEDHWRLFPINVAQGSLHGSSKDRDKMVAMSLRKMHAISNKELLRKLEVGNIPQIEKELAEEAKAMAQAQPQGRTPRGNREQRTGKM